MKPNDNSEIFLNALISQIESHLRTVGGVYLTTGLIAPSPIPIPGAATWTGYSMDEQFEGVIEEGEDAIEEDLRNENEKDDDTPDTEIGETKRILGKVPIGEEWETPREMTVVDLKVNLEANEVTLTSADIRRITREARSYGGGGGSDEETDSNPPVIGSNVGATAPPRPPGSTKDESNGRLDTKKLMRIDSAYGSGMLHIEAAKQYNKMLAQAIKDKIEWRVSSTYRDIAGQISCYEKYGPGSAAKPGSSPHGWGLAIDFGEICGTQQRKAKELGVGRAHPSAAKYTREHSKNYYWLAKNGPKYGWYNPYRLADGGGMDEAWHWEYWGFYTLSEDERKG
jgi:hypothetical protein